MNPKFSIIITSYNQRQVFEKYILPALKSQTCRDFEVIIGNDGGSDHMEQLSGHEHGFWICHVWQEDKGYGYTSIVNKAVAEASGEYLVFLSGDTYPTPTFLEELARALKPHRVVNGIRVKVDANGMELSRDWRLKGLPAMERMMMKQGVEMFPMNHYPFPWVHMTMNTLACSRLIWDAVGGITADYDGGYGKMDWSFCMKAYYSNFELWWQTAAVAFELNNGKPGREDNEKNNLFFDEEVEIWQNKSKRV